MAILIAKVEQYHFEEDVELCQAARICGLSEITLWRYRHRLRFGGAPLQKRGRRKLALFEDDILKGELRNLAHRQKRSLGSGKLRMKYKFLISKETMNSLIREVRAELKRRRLSKSTRVHWHCPHMVWAMDDYYYCARRSVSNQSSAGCDLEIQV